VIPFASPLYFGLLLYVLVPVIGLGLTGRLRGKWILAISLSAAAVQLAMAGELARAAAFLAFELAVIACFRAARRRRVPHAVWIAVVATLVPILLVRLTGSTTLGSRFAFLGVSYVTFRVLDVILGIQDGIIDVLDWPSLFGYLFFFPTLTSGPVDRFRRFTADFRRVLTRAQYLDLLDSAVPLMIRGLLYKFLLAATVQERLLDPIGARHGLLATIAYMYAFTAFLFFDFAGYSAMAIATSRVLGIETPPNFDRPFLSRNIVEFWSRWHISLSFWFRDHVYMRFVLAAKRGKWFSDRHLPSYLGLLVSFGLMGVWHGFAWHFLLYGLFHAALLIGHSVFVRWNAVRKVWGEGRGWQIAGILLTAQAYAFSLLLFSGRLFAR
jgi:membrane protein involved in D-alanine export